MNYPVIHAASCPVWSSGDEIDCACEVCDQTWFIRNTPTELFPWRVWRRMNDGSYEPLMRCSTFEGARQLANQLQWLRLNAIRRDDSNV